MIIVAFFVLAALATAQGEHNVDKIKLDVYYESQCPGCCSFFLKQLRPTSKTLVKYMETNLVPYGNAETIRNGSEVSFRCQHGEPECLLTKIHACGLARVGDDNLQRVLLASCLFEDIYNPTKAGNKCSPQFGLKWSEVYGCATGSEGNYLLDKYGNETNSLNPPLPYVPHMAVNKYRGDSDFQGKMYGNLTRVICDFLAKEKVTPPECK